MCGVCVSILSKLRTGALLELHVGLVYFSIAGCLFMYIMMCHGLLVILLKMNYRKDWTVFTVIIFSNPWELLQRTRKRRRKSFPNFHSRWDQLCKCASSISLSTVSVPALFFGLRRPAMEKINATLIHLNVSMLYQDKHCQTHHMHTPTHVPHFNGADLRDQSPKS